MFRSLLLGLGSALKMRPGVYTAGPGAPLSGTARAARASCTESCCCPSITGTVEGSTAASKTSDEGPGASVLCTEFGLRKQIFFCPTSCCRSNFLLFPRLRLLSPTERSCWLSFLTLQGGNSIEQSSCAWVPPSGGNREHTGCTLSSSALCRLRLASASSLALLFLILQGGVHHNPDHSPHLHGRHFRCTEAHSAGPRSSYCKLAFQSG